MLKIYPLMRNLESGKFVQKVKYGCEVAGLETGVCRLQMQPLKEHEKHEIRQAIEPILSA